MVQAAAACLWIAVAIGHVQCSSVGSSFRASLLALAHDRINVWYENKDNLMDAQVKDGISFRLSKTDKICSGTGVPLTFLDFKIDGIRAIDAFNAISDIVNEPSWDEVNVAAYHLADMQKMRARAYATVMSASAGPISMTREFFEWQVVDANFTSGEFWSVCSTLNNEDLLQMRSPTPGAVEAQNCLAAFRIRSVSDGVHIVVSQQPVSHPPLITDRDVAGLAFPDTIKWVKSFIGQARKQAALEWNDTRTILPDWMLLNHEENCTVDLPNVNLQRSLLENALRELDRKNPGSKEADQKLPGGEKLHSWRRLGQCGNTDIGAQKLPLWQAEFRIPSAQPADVFNVIANKEHEPRWNSQVTRMRIADFSSGTNAGVRGVHEEHAAPTGLPIWFKEGPSELWEWQAANHSLENQTYMVVLASTAAAESSKFGRRNKEAVQCLAAYKVYPASTNGTQVRMVTHLNPNSMLPQQAGWMWNSINRKRLGKYAAELTAEVHRLVSVRGRGGQAITDGTLLTLLSPAPPGRNRSVSIAQVLEAKGKDVFRKFAQLDLPHVLNTSAWAVENFATHASELSSLAQRLKANMTALEYEAFRPAVALDVIDVQTQGECLSAAQLRVIQELAIEDCAGSSSSGLLPDDDDVDRPTEKPRLILVAAGAFAVLMLFCVAMVCCCLKCRRRLREKRALGPASARHCFKTLLLDEDRRAGVDVIPA